LDFPDQSTGDQFFDEEQFEAYRELGYEIAKRVAPQIEMLFEKKSVASPKSGVPPTRVRWKRSSPPEVYPQAAE
jgi:hypothetical protein